jgi:hypothetical protein
MKGFAVTLFFMSTFLFARAQNKSVMAKEKSAVTRDKSDVASDRLRGNVKSITITSYKLKPNPDKFLKGRHILTSYSRYDANGNIVEFVTSAVEDTVDGEAINLKPSKIKYKYDNEGNLTGKIDYNQNGSVEDSSFYHVDNTGNQIDYFTYKGDGTLESKLTSLYNNQGIILESNEYTKGKLTLRNTYKYDSKFNNTEESCYWADGTLKWREAFSYDKKGNLEEVTDYKLNGRFESRFTYKYDDKDNVIEENEYNSDTSTRHKRITSRYAANGAVVETNRFNEDGILVFTLKLDREGVKLTNTTYNADGSFKGLTTKTYDERGNEILEDRFFANEMLNVKFSHTYEYDKEGNWTRKITHKDEIPMEVTDRKIEYY